MLNVSVRFSPLQYMSNVDSWCKACGEVDLPSELQDLEDAIHHHQGLYEHITAAYAEVTPHFICIFNVKLRVLNNILHHNITQTWTCSCYVSINHGGAQVWAEVPSAILAILAELPLRRGKKTTFIFKFIIFHNLLLFL